MVSKRNEIIIKDSCILFDVVDLDIIKDFFLLEDVIVYTTPQVIDEIRDENQLNEITKFIDSKKLLIDGEGQYSEILSVTHGCHGLSFADASVIECAHRKNAMILSSDKTLRNEAARKCLTVGGILWIIEELVMKNIITIEAAVDKLKLYPVINSRAPKEDIKKLIIKFQNNL